MKTIFLYLLAIIVAATSCQDDSETEAITPETPNPVNFFLIDADTSDVLPDYSLNAPYPDGELQVEENYFVDPQTNRFTLNQGNFLVEYAQEFIRASHINQNAMCPNGLSSHCNQERERASLWHWAGNLIPEDTLVWQYVDDAQPEQGYRWIMTEKPRQIKIVDAPAAIRPGQSQTISYQKASDVDSLLLELVIIPKSELLEAHALPSVNHSRIHHNLSDWSTGNQITLPAEEVDDLFERNRLLADTDTAFWNVASVRKIVKVINGKQFQITYQVNNLHPLAIENE